jgi:formiminotetrahydrofolate cyclodeaminase
MRRKYITTHVLLACLSKPKDRKKDIHTQLKETIAEHTKRRLELEKLWEEQPHLFRRIGKDAA